MVMMIINYISYCYAPENDNGFVYITNMSSNDFCHGGLTVLMVIFHFFSKILWLKMFSIANEGDEKDNKNYYYNPRLL